MCTSPDSFVAEPEQPLVKKREISSYSDQDDKKSETYRLKLIAQKNPEPSRKVSEASTTAAPKKKKTEWTPIQKPTKKIEAESAESISAPGFVQKVAPENPQYSPTHFKKYKNPIETGSVTTQVGTSTTYTKATPTPSPAPASIPQVGEFDYSDAVTDQDSSTISWTSAENAEFYLTKYGTASGDYSMQAYGDSPIDLADLVPGTTYFVQTLASNSGSFKKSSELMIKPIANFDFTATVSSSNSATVTWPTVIGADNYSVVYGTQSGTYETSTSCLSSPCTVSGLSSGTTYYFQVISKNSVGYGTTMFASNEQSIVPMDAPAVTNLTSTAETATTGSITVEWTGSAGTSSYVVTYGIVSGVYPNVIANATSPTVISGLNSGTTYYFVIQAKNSNGTVLSRRYTAVPLGITTEYFNLSSSSNYWIGQGATVSGNQIALIQSTTVNEKTLNGTGNSYNNVFDTYQSKSSNVSVSGDRVTLSSGLSGQYTSVPFDGLNSVVPWNLMSFDSSLPFYKEIANGQETSYRTTPANFATNLVLLWHLNETSLNTISGRDFSDSSGNGNTGKLYVGSASLGATGRFGKAVNFTGGSVISKNAFSQPPVFTESIWFKTNTLLGGKLIGFENNSVGNGGHYDRHIYMTKAGKLIFGAFIGSTRVVQSALSYNDDKWHHAVGTISPAGMYLYIDGAQVGYDSNTASESFVGWWRIGGGTLGSWPSNPNTTSFIGTLDEAAVWNNRALTLSEVRQLYRRGANRIKMQIRTCSAASSNDCAGAVSSWVGPDGTSASYFTELNNNSNPVTQLGTVGLSTFTTAWNLFTGGFSSWASSTTNSLNKYIQYQLTLESDTTSFYPDLARVIFSPSPRYVTSSSVSSQNSASLNFVAINQVQVTQSCNGLARYDFTPDGSNYYSWNGSSWAINSIGSTGANTSTLVNSLSQAAWNSFPTTSSFGFRAHLNSTGSSACTVSSVAVTGQK